MVKALAKEGEAIISDMTPLSAHLLHMALGVAGEAAEITEHLFAVAVHNLPFDRVHFVKELGDMEFFLEGLVQRQSVAPIDEWAVLPEDPAFKDLPEDTYGMEMMNATTALLQIHSGRLLDHVKKFALYCQDLNLLEYSRAIYWVRRDLGVIRDANKITHDECLEENMKKLAARYGKTFSNKAAQVRADEIPLSASSEIAEATRAAEVSGSAAT